MLFSTALAAAPTMAATGCNDTAMALTGAGFVTLVGVADAGVSGLLALALLPTRIHESGVSRFLKGGLLY